MRGGAGGMHARQRWVSVPTRARASPISCQKPPRRQRISSLALGIDWRCSGHRWMRRKGPCGPSSPPAHKRCGRLSLGRSITPGYACEISHNRCRTFYCDTDIFKLYDRIPSQWGRAFASIPWHASSDPARPPRCVTYAAVIIGDAKLEPARWANLIRPPARGRTGGFVEFRIGTDRAYIALHYSLPSGVQGGLPG